MRAIPMLFALTVGGVCYADAMGWIPGPASLMHPKSRPHVQKVEIDLTAAPKGDVDLKPAVVDLDIEWVADLKRATLTGDTETEEEKRLFWHTEWGDNPGVPFGGWGDPDPLVYPVLTATHSPDNPGFHFVVDPPRRQSFTEMQGAARIAEFLHEESLPVVVAVADPGVREARKHHHRDHSPVKPIDDPLTPIDESKLPILPGLPGGQIGSPIPEPSTWFTLGIGFVCLALVGRRKRARLVS